MANVTDLLPPIPENIAAMTAPPLIGTLFNWALYGVLSVQAYVYYLNFPDDTIWNKLLVYGSYIFEMVQTAMTAADLYFWFASGYGNLNHLGNVNISPADTPILCGIMAAVVQFFFAYRIYTLRKSYIWICVLIILTSIIQTAGGFGLAIRAFKLQDFSRFHEDEMFPSSIFLWLVGDTVCDVLIAGTMLWLFYQSRKEGLMHGTQILGKLVRLVVETNTLTASIAFVSLMVYTVLPTSNIFIATTLVMGKLYSNTLLMTFNNRLALRKLALVQGGEGSGDSDRRPIRQPMNFNSDVSTFRVAPDSFSKKSAGQESYEIETFSENKARDLSSLGSTV